MKAFKQFIILFFVFLVTVAIVQSIASSTHISNGSKETAIEVKYFEEQVDSFVVYKVVLRVPRGTVIQTNNSPPYEVFEEEHEFVLSHRFHRVPPSKDIEGSYVDSGVDTVFFGPVVSTRDSFNLIVDSGSNPIYPIERYIELPAAGTHFIAEGETFTLAEVDDGIYTVKIISIPPIESALLTF